MSTFWKRNAKAWGKKHGNKVWAASFAGLIIILVIGGIFGGWFGALTQQGEEGEFDVMAWDGGRNIKLPSSAFDWTLYGIKTGGSIADFSSYKQLDTGTSLADLTVSDLKTEYIGWIMKANGTVLSTWWDADDPIVEDIDETYDHGYYERWFVLNNAIVNYLIFYETPSASNVVVLDSQAFTVIANLTATPIVAKTNVTIICATNASQPFARYVSGSDYANENLDTPYIAITFNASIGMSDVSVSGTNKVRISATQIKFSFGILSPYPSIFSLLWSDDVVAGDYEITDICLYFGGTLLASVPT